MCREEGSGILLVFTSTVMPPLNNLHTCDSLTLIYATTYSNRKKGREERVEDSVKESYKHMPCRFYSAIKILCFVQFSQLHMYASVNNY